MQEDWEEQTVVAGEVVAPASGRKRAQLIVLAGPNVGEMYEIDSNLIIGRGREADVRVQGDGISRKHATIRTSGERARHLQREAHILKRMAGIDELTIDPEAQRLPRSEFR